MTEKVVPDQVMKTLDFADVVPEGMMGEIDL
jgi:hypothetical protein